MDGLYWQALARVRVCQDMWWTWSVSQSKLMTKWIVVLFLCSTAYCYIGVLCRIARFLLVLS
jgi:hypothetical protein